MTKTGFKQAVPLSAVRPKTVSSPHKRIFVCAWNQLAWCHSWASLSSCPARRKENLWSPWPWQLSAVAPGSKTHQTDARSCWLSLWTTSKAFSFLNTNLQLFPLVVTVLSGERVLKSKYKIVPVDTKQISRSGAPLHNPHASLHKLQVSTPPPLPGDNKQFGKISAKIVTASKLFLCKRTLWCLDFATKTYVSYLLMKYKFSCLSWQRFFRNLTTKMARTCSLNFVLRFSSSAHHVKRFQKKF